MPPRPPSGLAPEGGLTRNDEKNTGRQAAKAPAGIFVASNRAPGKQALSWTSVSDRWVRRIGLS